MRDMKEGRKILWWLEMKADVEHSKGDIDCHQRARRCRRERSRSMTYDEDERRWRGRKEEKEYIII